MSTGTVVNQTNNQFHIDYDISKIFIWSNRFEQGTFLNNSGGVASFAAGTVLGRIAASGKLVILNSAGTDGSQYPVGVLKTAITDLADTGEVEVNMCIEGDVAKEKIVLGGSDTLATVVELKTIEDRIKSDTKGIKLVEGTELTEFDNQ